jgi:hypothetical protein
MLKLQPYVQDSVAHHPCPKFAYKFFGPFEIADKIGASDYKLKLPILVRSIRCFMFQRNSSLIVLLCSLLWLSYLHWIWLTWTLEKILDRQLVKKGNMAVVQILVVVGAARIIGHLERSQCSSCKVFISSSLGTGYVFRRDHLGGNGLNLTAVHED